MAKLTLTTKPFASQAQQRFAFGTGQPWAKRWAAETNFSTLPKRVRKKRKVRTKSFTIDQLELFVSSDFYDPDTADLIASFIPALKAAPAPAAGAPGEKLGPGITRIRGNLCNVHGRYGPCSGGGSAKKPKGRGKRKPAKPKVDRAAEHAKNRAATLGSLGISAGDQQALSALRDGQQPASVSQDMIDKGMVERAADGSYRMTASGRALLGAADQGDAGRARDTISAAQERTQARAGRQAEQAKRQQDAAGKRATAQMDRELRKREADAKRAARQQAAAARRAAAAKKPAGGSTTPPAAPKPAAPKPAPPAPSRAAGGSSGSGSSGGGGGGGATAAPPKPTKAETAATNVAAVRKRMAENDIGLAPSGVDALVAFAGGTQPNAQAAGDFVKMGLAERGADGAYHLTPDARSVVSAMNAGDYQKAVDAINTAQQRADAAAAKRQTTKAASPGDYLIVEDPKLSSTWHLQVKRNGKPDHGLMGSAWAALHSGFRGNVYQGPGKAEALSKLKKLYAAEGMPLPSEKAVSFRVFKDALGRWRWVSQSSTAFQDRDKEIVSTKALAEDCDWSDKTGAYGPLRWWHVPGLDLGDTDFNAMHGRVLIESGTFRSEAIATKVARAADGLEVSLGFLHLPTEPDADGVFHHIRKFERSLVPRGKASNRFTAFTVKELPMDEQKIAGLKQLGFSDDDIAALQGQAAATEKAAEDQKVAYKADEPELQEITIAGVTYQLVEKAMAAPMMSDAAAETPAEDTAEGGMEEPADTGDGLTLSPEDIAAIGQAVAEALQQALGPLVSTMDLTNKIGSHMDELKSMMGGYTTKKDAEAAQTAEALAALTTTVTAQKAQLDDLLGLQPAVAPRASTSATSALNPVNPDDQALVAAVKDQLPETHTNGFEDLRKNILGW